MDFQQIISPFVRNVAIPSTTSTNLRRECFGITIRDDDIDEDTEFFTVNLALAEGTSGVIIYPNITEIFILDDDGSSYLKLTIFLKFVVKIMN